MAYLINFAPQRPNAFSTKSECVFNEASSTATTRTKLRER